MRELTQYSAVAAGVPQLATPQLINAVSQLHMSWDRQFPVPDLPPLTTNLISLLLHWCSTDTAIVSLM